MPSLVKLSKQLPNGSTFQKNIAPLIKPPRKANKEVTVWTMEQANSFLSLVEGRWLFIAYVLAIYTGMRKGEILGLRWKDCDLEQGRVSITQTLCKVDGKLIFQEPKTKGSKRSITLPEYAIWCLKRHKVLQNALKLKLGPAYQDHDLVVTTATGGPIDPANVNQDLNYTIKKYNLPKIRFHDFRHTHATILLQLGENPKVVSERLGHSNIGITLDAYSHVLPDMQKNLAENFDLAMKVKKNASNGNSV